MAEKLALPRRSAKYGVGKEIGGAVYLHREYEYLPGVSVCLAKKHLPCGFDYTVVKYSPKTGTVSFIHSPDFDAAPEPTVGDIWTISGDGRAQLHRQPSDPYIYHHKWLFVADDYGGFNIEESKARSRAWLSLKEVDRRRIGKRSYWTTAVLPRVQPNER